MELNFSKRQDLISLYKRKGFKKAPIGFSLCPSLYETFKQKTGEEDYEDYFEFPVRNIPDFIVEKTEPAVFKKYYDFELARGTEIDMWGVAHEPGSEAAKHMTRMRHPLANIDSLDQLKEYPFPDYKNADTRHQKEFVEKIHAKGLAAVGNMQCTVWETAWYMRSMEELMMDMQAEDDMAEFILDKVTDYACHRAAAFAHSGADMIFLGDDIGMQRQIMMSKEMYQTWLKPRLKKVIDTARKINPDVLILYHTCGFVTPLINDLIEAGIDVLNPVQPECMNFKEIHAEFGDRLSFNGTIGTQTTMPFGTPDDVKREVYRNLEIAGDKGGLYCVPTHLLEPEVPWENIIAYVEACKSFK